MSCQGNPCSGHCKTIVRRIVEQVRAETEQWSQMQEMLGQVREEMEELQASRDFWEDKALHSDFQIQSLHNAVRFISLLTVVLHFTFTSSCSLGNTCKL
jgi:small subunit ribosomal protein S2e